MPPSTKLASSMSTTFTLLSQMIGGTMLTLPILFREAGLVTGTIVLFVSGVISFLTCASYVRPMRRGQLQVEQTIKRLLGRSWQRLFILVTGYYLMLLNVIYVCLIVDQTYNIANYISAKSGNGKLPSKDKFTMNEFSLQYLSIILAVPLLGLAMIKNLRVLLKLASFGVMSVFSYVVFIVFEMIDRFDTIQWDAAKWLTSSVGNLGGTCALAFTIHTVVTPVMLQHAHPERNIPVLRLAYLLGFLMYMAIGVLGALPILIVDCQVTILNCYLDDWQAIFVSGAYLYGLLTVFPGFLAVGRDRLFSYYYPNTPLCAQHQTGLTSESLSDNLLSPVEVPTSLQPPFRRRLLFNLAFIIVSSLFSFLSPFLPLDLVMNLVGSLVCFFFIYLIPCQLELANKATTYLESQNKTYKNTASILTDQQLLNTDQKLSGQAIGAQKKENEDPSSFLGVKKDTVPLAHITHLPVWIFRQNSTKLKAHTVVYELMMGLGFFIGIYGLYGVINNLISG